MPASTTEAPTKPAVPMKLLAVFLAGAAVSVSLGVYSGVHDPTAETPYKLFFSSTLSFKVWFATFAVGFAGIQILTAARLYGKIKVPKRLPGWFGDLHRLSGTLAFGFSLPVAYHCLWALGFQTTVPNGLHSNRVLAHSLLGCVFFGAFTIKVLSVRVRGLPSWMLPLAGGVTFAILVLIWTTSSVWYWREVGFPSI